MFFYHAVFSTLVVCTHRFYIPPSVNTLSRVSCSSKWFFHVSTCAYTKHDGDDHSP
jgi:hypothetical protein